MHGVRWLPLKAVADGRGLLVAAEVPMDIPFEIKRVFFLCGVSTDAQRGGHAHPQTEQVLIPLAGSLAVDVMDGSDAERFELDDPARALYLPAMTWVRLHSFQGPQTVCLALASTLYEPDAVIRDWERFLMCKTSGADQR